MKISCICPREPKRAETGSRARTLLLPLWAAFVLLATRAGAELVLLPATNMTGIARWKPNQSWGAGPFFSTDGSSLSQTAEFAGW